MCDLLYHQTLISGGLVGTAGIRSLPSNVKVPGSIPGSAKIWAFVGPSKLIQLSILTRSVNRGLASAWRWIIFQLAMDGYAARVNKNSDPLKIWKPKIRPYGSLCLVKKV